MGLAARTRLLNCPRIVPESIVGVGSEGAHHEMPGGELELVGFPLEHPPQLVVPLSPFRLHPPHHRRRESPLGGVRRWRAPPRLGLLVPVSGGGALHLALVSSYPCRRFRGERGGAGRSNAGSDARAAAVHGLGGSSKFSSRLPCDARGDGGASPLAMVALASSDNAPGNLIRPGDV